jgi:DNA-binding NtrC family response regulator
MSMERCLALVVDRDPSVRAALRDVLERRQVLTLSAESVGDALDTLATRPVDLLIVDVEGGTAPSRNVLRHARQLSRPPLMLGITEAAAGPPEAGLFDLLEKPLSDERLEFVVDRALRQFELMEELRRVRESVRSREGFEGLVGRSGALERIRAELIRLADSDLSVWFTGEGGVGKAHAARALHDLSPRKGSAFVVIECERLSVAEWEAQWAAFDSGAPAAGSPGARAIGGTIYLREILALDGGVQQRILESFERWPRHDAARSTAEPGVPRVLAGTREDPERAEEQGRLLPALRARLAESRLHMPPLRDRIEDVGLLAPHFVEVICRINQLPPIRLAPEALFALERFAWPGNVRELRNAMEHAAILAVEGIVRLQDLPDRLLEGDLPDENDPVRHRAVGPFREAKREVVDAFELAYLSDLLDKHGGNVTSAAQHAGMLRSALQRLLRKHGLKSAHFRRKGTAARRRPGGTAPTVD